MNLNKYKYLVIILFWSEIYFPQKISFSPTIKVTYEAKLQLGKNFSKNQDFVLIGNSSDYYFGAAQNYLNDTKQYETSGLDFQSISDYFQERIIKQDNKFNVLYTFADTKIKYQEVVITNWVLYSDTKVIAGIKCQLATTNKYGRRWFAYFSKNYEQNIGPYKFSGLPGLILELYDLRDDYHFKAIKIEPYKKDFEFNIGNYKNYQKSEYIKAKYNLEYEGAGFPQMDSQMKKDYSKITELLKEKSNNPLELKPFIPN